MRRITRPKQELPETVKLEDHPLRDETIMTNSRIIVDLNSKAISESQELNPVKGQLVVDASIDQQRQRLHGKIKKVSLVGSRSNGYLNLVPTLKKRSSHQDLTMHENLPLMSIKSEYQGDVSSSQKKAKIKSVPESKFDSFILMSCRKCYLHVLVSETDPKCPKCGKRECLLDIYRENHMKKAKIM
nr:protein phosphatase 2C family protein [Tanacetum cinerariifolium]